MPQDSSKTIQERIAATHVRDLDIDTNAMAVISNIFRVVVMFRNTAERRFLNAGNLSFSGFTVLWVLWVWGEMESYQLAEECGITKGTLTGIVSTLEKSDLVKRKPHKTDGRRRLVRATPKGRGLAKRMFLQINGLEKEFVKQLKSHEIAEMGRMLRIILHSREQR